MILKVNKKELIKACGWLQLKWKIAETVQPNLYQINGGSVSFTIPQGSGKENIRMDHIKTRALIKLYRGKGGDELKYAAISFSRELLSRNELECHGGYYGPMREFKNMIIITTPSGDSDGQYQEIYIFKIKDLIKFYLQCKREIVSFLGQGVFDKKPGSLYEIKSETWDDFSMEEELLKLQIKEEQENE